MEFTGTLESARGGGAFALGVHKTDPRPAAMPPSHRREYAEWVASAKQQQTRDRRAAKVIEALRVAD